MNKTSFTNTLNRSRSLIPFPILNLLLLLLMILTACSTAQDQEAQPTVSEGGETSLADTPRPTIPPSPTSTPSPTTPTMESKSSTELADQDTIATELLTEKLSPDGHWRAVALASKNVPPVEGDEEFPNGKYFVEMIVEKTDGSEFWPVLKEWRHGGLGQDYPQAVRWSGDGRYFYYANVPRPDGCSVLANGGALWRLDLESGDVEEIAPYIGLVMALSPDETRLAVNASYGRGFLIRDLDSGIEHPVPLPAPEDSWAIGDLQWSPDGQRLLMIKVTNPCMPVSETAVVIIDANAQTAATLVEAQEHRFTIQEWPEENTVLLNDGAGNIWRLDLSSGELSNNE